MDRSFLRYSHTFLLLLLAVGLVLMGCDSTGSNGGNGDDESDAFAYPSNNYGAETVTNLLAFDLGVRVGNASDHTEAVLDELYTGTIDDKTVPTSGISAQQSTYGDVASGVDLSSLTSDASLAQSQNLENGDSPNPGSQVTTDELLQFYFERAGSEDVTTTDNGIVLSQFAEKMLLGTPIYGQGAGILSDFADGSISSDQAEQWDAAFGSFGFPRTLEPFLNYSNGEEGLADGNVARDVDGNGSVDLTSEYVHTWASYAIERSAAAENNGQPNDFARRAFEALVEGREAIENGDDPSEHAQTALDAWEKVVAVNVIHYTNSMQSSLKDVSGEITRDKLADASGFENSWGEAKAFAWGLQFYSREALGSDDLSTILEHIGNDPPYNELTASEYSDLLGEGVDTDGDGEIEVQGVKHILESTYNFNSSNVEAW